MAYALMADHGLVLLIVQPELRVLEQPMRLCPGVGRTGERLFGRSQPIEAVSELAGHATIDTASILSTQELVGKITAIMSGDEPSTLTAG